MTTKTKRSELARLKGILRGFWGNDRKTQVRQIREAMEVLDPEAKIWRRDKPATRATLH